MPKPKAQPDPIREKFWRQTIAAWQASGHTIREFCQHRQLKKTSFDYWRSELQRRDDGDMGLSQQVFTEAFLLSASKQ